MLSNSDCCCWQTFTQQEQNLIVYSSSLGNNIVKSQCQQLRTLVSHFDVFEVKRVKWKHTREVTGNQTTELWQPDNHQPPVLSGFLSLFRPRKPLSMGSFLMDRILQSIPNRVLTAHTEWLLDAWLSPTCAVHVEDCEGWWFSVCCSSVIEHQLHKPGVPESPAI